MEWWRLGVEAPRNRAGKRVVGASRAPTTVKQQGRLRSDKSERAGATALARTDGCA